MPQGLIPQTVFKNNRNNVFKNDGCLLDSLFSSRNVMKCVFPKKQP